MTTTPTKPSLTILRAAGLSAYPPTSWSPNVTARLVQAMLAYLDEQHAAGRGELERPSTLQAAFDAGVEKQRSLQRTEAKAAKEWRPSRGNYVRHKTTRRAGLVEDVFNDSTVCVKGWTYRVPASELEIATVFEQTDAPETGERAPSPEPAPGSLECAHPEVSKLSGHCLTCPARVWQLPNESAPIAEPPSPVAGEPTADMWTEACAEALRYKGERDEALAQVEALTKAVSHEQKERAWAMREWNNDVSALASANARAEALEKELPELRAFREEWAAKDGNSPGYNLDKAKNYGAKAAEHKQRADRAERDLTEARSQLASERAAHEVTRGTLREALLDAELLVPFVRGGSRDASTTRYIFEARDRLEAALAKLDSDLASPSEPAPSSGKRKPNERA